MFVMVDYFIKKYINFKIINVQEVLTTNLIKAFKLHPTQSRSSSSKSSSKSLKSLEK
jgi:hypothetical protein